MSQRSYALLPCRNITHFSLFIAKPPPKPSSVRSCPLCQQAGSPNFHSHFLSKYKFLPESDSLFMSWVCQVTGLNSNKNMYGYHDYSSDQMDSPVLPDFSNVQSCPSGILSTLERSVSRWVNISPSLFLHTFYHHQCFTFDTGPETNMMRTSLAKHIGAKITKVKLPVHFAS